MIDEPRHNDLYRNRRTGLMFRVLDVDFYKVTAVQESPLPDWTWRGDRMDFLVDFGFVCHHAFVHNRLNKYL